LLCLGEVHMAANLQDAENKWARKTQNAGQKWASGVQAAGAGAYCEGLAKFGINPAACMQGPGAAWQAGVSAVGPQGFQAAIAGKADKWARNFIRGIQGG
jgi:hypothetical protein